MINSDEHSVFSSADKEGYDLIVYQCGMEKCKAGHSYGPAIRDHFLIHHVLSGSGTFYVDGKSYQLEKNQGFLICPDVVTYYEASTEDPWVYAWIGFKGIKAEPYLKQANLTRTTPVFYYEGDFLAKCLVDIIESKKLKYGCDLRIQGFLSIFLSELIEKSGKETDTGSNYKDIYIKKMIQFIETNYSRHITINDIAQHIGLNKNYFSAFIKENLGISPQAYLIKYRINKACFLMENRSLTISDIARSVGYEDPLGFSKIFKQAKGLSPKVYREKMSSLT